MNQGKNENKRKFHWNKGDRGGKRFQKNRNHQQENERNNMSRWDWGPQQGGGPNFPNYNDWGYNNRNHYNRFPRPFINAHYQQIFDPPAPVLADTSREKDDTSDIGPGSNAERMEKVLATKKRIEEALASKPSFDNSQELPLQESSKENNKDKTIDVNSSVNNLELRLTNSDFREIGSVASGVVVEGDAEGSDLILNIAPCSSQQRSFENTSVTTNLPANKPQKIGGWTISAPNEIISNDSANASQVRGGGEMYFQERSERILGNVQTNQGLTERILGSVQPNTNDGIGNSSAPKFSNSVNTRSDFSRVGKLYHSFLKSRLSNWTLKVKEKTKPTGPNPLLNKSVLDDQVNKDTPAQKEKELELQMPNPIQVKIEHDSDITVNTSPTVIQEAEEGNEFCKEFSFLLKHPNFLIPPDDLEKLGLGHLSEMNRMVDEMVQKESSLEKQDNSLRVRSLTALNSVTGNDIAYNPENFSFNQELDPLQFLNSDLASSMSTVQDQGQYSVNNKSLNQQIPPEKHYPNSASGNQQNTVDNLVEKLVDKMLKSSNTLTQAINSRIQDQIKATTITRENAAGSKNQINLPPTVGDPPSLPQLNFVHDVSNKLLRMFLIDKQIEDLMAEKMKLHSEILSLREVSSSLFNSWAENHIQQGNVRNVIANTSATTRILNHSVPQTNTNEPSTSSHYLNNSLGDSISELISLKNETTHTAGADNVLIPPKTVIENNLEQPEMPLPQGNVENNRPKLSVRKDLHDPNLYVNMLQTFENPMETSREMNDLEMSQTTDTNDETILKEPKSSKKNKKKKKSKKKDDNDDTPLIVNIIPSVPIVNLIDSTDDETSTVSVDGGGTGNDSGTVSINNEQDSPQKLHIVNFDLKGYTTSCIKALKSALILGSKEGMLLVCDIKNGEVMFESKIHPETIVCLNECHRCIITGSTDSTVCVVSLEKESIIQTVQVCGPVQCFSMFEEDQLFVGTKTGFLIVYNVELKVAHEQKKVVDKSPKNNSNEEYDVYTSCLLTIDRDPMKISNSSIMCIKCIKDLKTKLLIIACRGEQVSVRNANTGEKLRVFSWCDTVYCLETLSPRIKDKFLPWVFCGTNTKSVRVVDFNTGEHIKDYLLGRSVNKIVIRNSLLFAACLDGKIYVYDIKANELVHTINASKGLITSIAVSSKKIFVSSNREKTLQVISFPTKLKTHIKRQNEEKIKQDEKNNK